ncbi:MAG: AraC family transcriptional regulator [Rheinheimera sp.]|uniref:GlxA family transcriptional regulator n=1 Tax=Arsukibacterium sp. UBA3155 TaxID=1946058 RepID=UPI000C96FA6D|nr:GlxA family transcriptional regulator [Arsukibacterium sp. UBA3155]MAD77449.1 AraC family transcriptional regulator [Rheinheimera sp.]|tara:strand:- start:9555 stop:10550 length:996 start_codon:yes stop_codon:yes gene_type:complete
MLRRKIGFLLFDQFNGQDLIGPLEAFHSVNNVTDSPYECIFIGQKAGPYRSEAGLTMLADISLQELALNDLNLADAALPNNTLLDTLIIPGGAGSRAPLVQAAICPWLRQVNPAIRRIASVCTGAFILAESGLLNGLQATTHWAFVEALAKHYPQIQVQANELFVDNGHIATSAGITSGIDLSLKLIENDLGSDIASQVARYLVVHFRRAGDQAQYSVPLQFQSKTDTRFSSLTGWVLQNLQRDLSISSLADYCGMSERNFYRHFVEQLGETPARYVDSLRLDYARQLLVEKTWPIDKIAEACGYQSSDAFRRAFVRKFLMAPNAYRQRFR